MNPRRAFTLIELLVVIAIISLLISILLPSLGKARLAARQLKDATNIRSIVQSFVLFAHTNQDDYPLPSRIDRADATVRTMISATEKDNTGNIFSLMIYQGYFPPEIAICPAEVNPQIRRDLEYEYAYPQRARIPASAAWDPGFAGYPGESGSGTGTGRRDPLTGSVSYAHIPPIGPRAAMWKSTFSSRDAVLGTRGPFYDGTPGLWTLRPGPSGQQSNRLKIFGNTGRWAGNLGFNDGRVAFFTQPDPDSIPIAFDQNVNGRRNHFDNVFVNEGADGRPLGEQFASEGGNALLRLYGDIFFPPASVAISPYVD
ncbi:MAG: prepilin-type N-terminal cleavage/methylation domain-containing protein [Phycisphaerales bacterium]|nr:prepilin-type N-terminal cleavage/methylation domain-containing protein [Phycisphaerales bacterium]